MTITEFLEARIAEDEAVAQEIAECESHDPPGRGYEGTIMEAVGHRRHGAITVDPARVLAECAAKRAILANIPRNSDLYDTRAYTSAHTIYAIASVYKDHPEYQQEWSLNG